MRNLQKAHIWSQEQSCNVEEKTASYSRLNNDAA